MGADERSPLLERPVTVGVALIIIWGLLRAAVLAAPYLLAGFFAIVIATVLTFPVALFTRLVPRGWAVLITLLLFLGAVVGGGFLVAPTVAGQVQEISSQLPHSLASVEEWLREKEQRATSTPVAKPQVGKQAAEKVVNKAPEVALTGVELVTGIVLVLALGFFLVHEPRDYLDGLAALLPPRQRGRIIGVIGHMGHALRRWSGGIFVSMLIMGTLAALGLWIAGMDAWLTLGLLTFFGTFVPYAGALASAIPGLALALARSPRELAWVTLVYLVVHIVEGYIVQPLIMKRAVELRPASLLMWQVVMAALFGPMGVIVATPLLACLKVGIRQLWVEQLA